MLPGNPIVFTPPLFAGRFPRSAFLLVLLLSAGCSASGKGAGCLPPLPEEKPVSFPAALEGADLWARLPGGLLDDHPGELLLAHKPGGAFWMGAPAEGGGWETRLASTGLEAAGSITQMLPGSGLAVGGRLDALLGLLDARFPAGLTGLPLLLPGLAAGLPAPETEAEAQLQALGFALALLGSQTLAASPGGFSAGLAELGEAPSLSLRLEAPPLDSPVSLGPLWAPRGLPQSVAMLRIEAASADLLPGYEAFLDSWGFEPPPPPVQDFACEVHLLGIGTRYGLVLALPPSWAPALPRTPSFAPSLPCPEIPFLSGMPAGKENGAAWGFHIFSREGAVFLVLGPPGFHKDLQASVGRDRPLPFAERRYRWPRGGIGILFDQGAFQGVMRSLSPIPLPSLKNSSNQAQVVEIYLGREEDHYRLYAAWPRAPETVAGISVPGQISSPVRRMLGRFLGPFLDRLGANQDQGG
ncbi:MAG: hypothetical protein ACE5H3_02545 [Planctomycetota bacterium]